MTNAKGRIKALLLAGGLGTRLRPLTDKIPKCLVSIGERPLLDYWIDRLADAGVREARINTHALPDQVRAYISRINSEERIRLVESYEPVLLGSAGTVTANADLADTADQIVIIYTDNLSDIDLRPLLAFHESHPDPFTMLLFHASNPRACGIAEIDHEGRIVSYSEKPEHPRSDLANAGLYVMDAAAYREIAAMDVFDLGFDVIPRFVGRMRGWLWGGYHRDIGTPEALASARQDVGEIFPESRGHDLSYPRPAVFLDRDGTVIEHVHYLSDPAHVQLRPGAAEALRLLRRAGFPCVLITNQSAIGRGLITEARLDEIHQEMNRQLAAKGVALDGIYYCPDVPSGEDRTKVENLNRKPGPGMLLQASRELGLKLRDSWMVGDLISDVLAGVNAGCRSILLTSGQTDPIEAEAQAMAGHFLTTPDLSSAVTAILNSRGSHS